MGNGRILTTTVRGHKMIVLADDLLISPHLILDGFWEPQITNVVLSAVRPGMRVLDIGANVGYYTILMADAIGATGSIVAFEPSTPVYNALRINMRLNGFEGRARLINAALGSDNATGQLVIPVPPAGMDYAGATVKFGSIPEDLFTVEDKIEVKRLDDLDLGPINFAKIDAQESEMAIWKGGRETLRRCDAIYLEFTPTDVASYALLEMIRADSFSTYAIDLDGSCAPCSEADIRSRIDRVGQIDLLLRK